MRDLKDFIIYMQLRRPDSPAKKEFSVQELKRYPGTSSIRELELVKGGKLSLVRETHSLHIFNFSCNFQLPRPLAARSVGYAEIGFDIYQQKEGNLIVTLNAPKKAAKVAISLLSYATHRDPFLIRAIQLTRSDFLSLKERILNGGGNLRQLIFWGIRDSNSEGADIRQFRLSGSRLERMPGFDEILGRSSRIRLLGFSFKPTADCREISFRLIDWGGGQLYSPADPLDHEILEFLSLFERVLIPGKHNASTK